MANFRYILFAERSYFLRNVSNWKALNENDINEEAEKT